MSHRCKKTFFTFFILVTFFTFFNVFYFFPRFLFSSNVVKEARGGRIFKVHGLTKAYAQLQLADKLQDMTYMEDNAPWSCLPPTEDHSDSDTDSNSD